MKLLKIFTSIALFAAILFSCSTPGVDTGSTGETAQVTAANDSLPTQAEIEAALIGTDGEPATGYILVNRQPVKVHYLKIGNVNLLEGDIILAEKNIFLTAEEALGKGAPGAISRSVVTTSGLWPNNTVNYVISPNVPSFANPIKEAIAQIEAKTSIKFVYGTSTNYIEIVPSSGSWSHVGCIGGKQQIGLGAGVKVGTVVHEICHALGVYHEHSRADRDQYITVHWENLKPGFEINFQIQNGPQDKDIGTFDFGSVMIYGCYGFSKNGLPTITKKDGSTYISQRDGLSPIDVQGLQFLYPGNGGGDKQAPTVPSGLTKGTVTSSSVGLSWTKSTDNVRVTGYKVYVDGVYNKTFTASSATISGLKALTTYKFEVSAIDAAGNESGKSISLSVTTPDGGGPTTWKAWTPYKTGDTVTYNGVTYVCQLSHNSLPGWEPANVPALWTKK